MMKEKLKERLPDLSHRSALLYLPDKQVFLHVAEGDGSNMTREDIRNGSVDYLYISVYRYTGVSADLEEIDGGMRLLSEPFEQKYGGRLHEAVWDAYQFMYGNEETDFVIIK